MLISNPMSGQLPNILKPIGTTRLIPYPISRPSIPGFPGLFTKYLDCLNLADIYFKLNIIIPTIIMHFN